MRPSEFLETRELCKGDYFMLNGKSAHESECDCCCTYGAIQAAGIKHVADFEWELGRVIGTPLIAYWNDRPETTKEMVLAALRETERRLGL